MITILLDNQHQHFHTLFHDWKHLRFKMYGFYLHIDNWWIIYKKTVPFVHKISQKLEKTFETDSFAKEMNIVYNFKNYSAAVCYPSNNYTWKIFIQRLLKIILVNWFKIMRHSFQFTTTIHWIKFIVLQLTAQQEKIHEFENFLLKTFESLLWFSLWFLLLLVKHFKDKSRRTSGK